MTYYVALKSAFNIVRTELSKVESFNANNPYIVGLFHELKNLVIKNPHAIACDETVLRVALYATFLQVSAAGGPRLKQILVDLAAPWVLPIDTDDYDFLEKFNVDIIFPDTWSPCLTDAKDLVDGFAFKFPKLPYDKRPIPRLVFANAKYGPYVSFQYLASGALTVYKELSEGPGITLDDTQKFVPFVSALAHFLADHPNILYTDVYACRAALFATVLYLAHLRHDDLLELAPYFCLPVDIPSLHVLNLGAPYMDVYHSTWQRIDEPTSSGFAIDFPVSTAPEGSFVQPFVPPVPTYPNIPPPGVSLSDASRSILCQSPLPLRSYYCELIKNMPLYRCFLGRKLKATDPGLLELCSLLASFVDRNPYAISRDPIMVKTAIFCQRLIQNAEGLNPELEALILAAGSWAVPVDLTATETALFDGNIDYPHVLYPRFVHPDRLIGNYALAFPRLEGADDPAIDEHHHPTPYDWVMHLASNLAYHFHENNVDHNSLLRADNPALHRLFVELAHFLSVRPHMVAYDVNICRLALTCASIFPRVTGRPVYDGCARVWRFPLDVSGTHLWDPPLNMDFFRGAGTRLRPEVLLPVDPAYPYATPITLPFLSDDVIGAGPFASPPFVGDPTLEFGCKCSYNVLALPETFVDEFTADLAANTSSFCQGKGNGKSTVASNWEFPRLNLLSAVGPLYVSGSREELSLPLPLLASSGEEFLAHNTETEANDNIPNASGADSAVGFKRKAIHLPSRKPVRKSLCESTSGQRKRVIVSSDDEDKDSLPPSSHSLKEASGRNFVEQVNQARMFERLCVAQGIAYNNSLHSADCAWHHVGELAVHFCRSIVPDVYAQLFHPGETLSELLRTDPEELVARMIQLFIKLDVSQILNLSHLENGNDGSSHNANIGEDDAEANTQ